MLLREEEYMQLMCEELQNRTKRLSGIFKHYRIHQLSFKWQEKTLIHKHTQVNIFVKVSYTN